jgi:hypothetical protein
MAVNKSARPIKLTINGKDYTPGLKDIRSWEDSAVGQSGHINNTCSLTLIKVDGLPGNLNPKDNTDFALGNPIVIEQARSNGVFVRHPRGALRVLKATLAEDGRSLTIQAGDQITLLDYRQSTDSRKITNEPGQTTSSSAIVAQLVSAAGISAIADDGNGFGINYPVDVKGSYLKTASDLLYSANNLAWIDRDEVYRIKPVNLSTAAFSPIAEIQIGGDGGDEIWYKPLGDSEGPREEIKANGVAKVCKPTPSGILREESRDELGPASSLGPQYGGGNIVLARYYLREEWDEASAVRYNFNLNWLPLGLALPDSTNPFKARLFPAEQIEHWRYYETTKQGKILRDVTRIRYMAGKILAEVFAALKAANINPAIAETDLIIAQEEVVTYEYDHKERPKRKVTQTWETIAAILEGLGEKWATNTLDPTDRRLSSELVETWEELRPEEWEYTPAEYNVYARQYADSVKATTTLDTKLGKCFVSRKSQDSNSGQQTPPAPERKLPKATFEDRQVESVARFQQFGNQFQERSRNFNVPFLPGLSEGGSGGAAKAVCAAIADREGKILVGKYHGASLALAVEDWLLDNWEPLLPVAVVEPDGTRRAYYLDAANWVAEPKESLCHFTCIWAGDLDGDNNIVKLPYIQARASRSAIAFSNRSKRYSYPLEVSRASQSALALSNRSTWELGEGSTLSWRSLTPENYRDLDAETYRNLEA